MRMGTYQGPFCFVVTRPLFCDLFCDLYAPQTKNFFLEERTLVGINHGGGANKGRKAPTGCVVWVGYGVEAMEAMEAVEAGAA